MWSARRPRNCRTKRGWVAGTATPRRSVSSAASTPWCQQLSDIAEGEMVSTLLRCAQLHSRRLGPLPSDATSRYLASTPKRPIIHNTCNEYLLLSRASCKHESSGNALMNRPLHLSLGARPLTILLVHAAAAIHTAAGLMHTSRLTRCQCRLVASQTRCQCRLVEIQHCPTCSPHLHRGSVPSPTAMAVYAQPEQFPDFPPPG